MACVVQSIAYACHQILVNNDVNKNHKASGNTAEPASMGNQAEVPIIHPGKLWAIKGHQFADRSISIFGAPGAGNVLRYKGSLHQKKRPVTQGIKSSRFYQKAVGDSIWQLTYGQKAVLTTGNDP